MSSENPVYAVISQGCAANFGEGEQIARALSARHPGCKILFRLPEAKTAQESHAAQEEARSSFTAQEAPDSIYLNVCTVKGNAGALKLLRTASEMFPGIPLFITGCTPKDFREEALKIAPQVIFTSLKEIAPLEQNEASATESMDAIVGPSTLRETPYVGIVNIEEGCLDACAFCSTHLVKGRLKSYAPEGIVEQVRGLVLLDLDVGVAGDAEDALAGHGVAGEEQRQEARDDLLGRDDVHAPV